MGVMANVFYIDLGFDKQDIGRITKGFGLVMTILGGVLGGLIILKRGIFFSLFIGATLAAFTNLLFVLLADIGSVQSFLILVISADNLSAGIASVALVAYLSSLTSTAFTASQYAIFSSVMLLIPKFVAGYSGMIVDSIGYKGFFFGTFCLGLPVLVLIGLIYKLSANRQ